MPFQPRVAILVPAPDYYEKWQPAFARKAAALTAAGLIVEQRVWTDPGDLSGHDLMLPLFVWGYQRDVAAWYALLDRLEANAAGGQSGAGAALEQRQGLSRRARVRRVSRWCRRSRSRRSTMLALPSDVRTRLTDDVVIKPAISGGADGTHRIAPGAPIPPMRRDSGVSSSH
jgi:hypothetical protein